MTTSLAVQVSAYANRTHARSLAGRTLAKKAYVFAVAPSARTVAFYLDDTSRRRAPMRVEHDAPFDLRGTSYGKAHPWALSGVLTGRHSLTVVSTLTDGRRVVKTVRFRVLGKPNPAYNAQVSTSASSARTHATALSGRTVRGTAYVFVTTTHPGRVAAVRFFLDDPARSADPDRIDASRPFDLVGSRGHRALGLDTRLLKPGVHSLAVAVRWKDGTVSLRLVRFRVAR